ncbi:uncharacterized protein [Rutidosis leptorrhynchoides]|uniref:uncharacterized protein n=1 Tax=Rutidosis leptorrhynchoides TaxID=125765 RepID=UPI003A9A43D6
MAQSTRSATNIPNVSLTPAQFQQLLAAAQGNHNNHGNNQGNPPTSCSYKEFMNCKPPSFKGNEEAYATHMLSGLALTWWNGYAQTVGLNAANAIPWPVLKRMMTEKLCPRNQIQKLEVEFWELKVKRTDIEAYTNRFIELVTLCPEMVPTELKKIGRYIEGLPEEIQGNVIAASKETLDAVILMAQNLMMAKRRKAAANKVAVPPTDTPATKANAIVPTCYDCGEKGHFCNQCLKKKGNTGNANAKS